MREKTSIVRGMVRDCVLVTNQIINLQRSSQTRQGENSVEMKNATKFLSLAIEIYPAVANLWLFFLTKA